MTSQLRNVKSLTGTPVASADFGATPTDQSAKKNLFAILPGGGAVGVFVMARIAAHHASGRYNYIGASGASMGHLIAIRMGQTMIGDTPERLGHDLETFAYDLSAAQLEQSALLSTLCQHALRLEDRHYEMQESFKAQIEMTPKPFRSMAIQAYGIAASLRDAMLTIQYAETKALIETLIETCWDGKKTLLRHDPIAFTQQWLARAAIDRAADFALLNKSSATFTVVGGYTAMPMAETQACPHTPCEEWHAIGVSNNPAIASQPLSAEAAALGGNLIGIMPPVTVDNLEVDGKTIGPARLCDLGYTVNPFISLPGIPELCRRQRAILPIYCTSALTDHPCPDSPNSHYKWNSQAFTKVTNRSIAHAKRNDADLPIIELPYPADIRPPPSMLDVSMNFGKRNVAYLLEAGRRAGERDVARGTLDEWHAAAYEGYKSKTARLYPVPALPQALPAALPARLAAV